MRFVLYLHSHCRMADIIEQEGGLKYLILLQREPNAYHVEWKKRFPKLERIVHRFAFVFSFSVLCF